MAATVFLSETNGPNASPVTTDNIANLNFGSLDAPNLVPSAHPINVGSFSVAKWWRLKLQALGGSAQISNGKIWKSAGAYVTGEVIGGVWNSGAPPTYSCKAYGTTITANASTGSMLTVPYTGNGQLLLGGNVWSAFAVYTSGPPAASDVWYNGAIGAVMNTPGAYSDWMPHGLATTGATPTGPVNTKTFTIQYDEA